MFAKGGSGLKMASLIGLGLRIAFSILHMKTKFCNSIRAFSLFALLTVVGPNLAQANSADPKSCPSVDLRQDFDFGLTRSQKFLGWCYSYAGADLVGHHIGENLSSFDLAAQVAQYRIEKHKINETRLTKVSGGSVRDLGTIVENVGVCSGNLITSSYPNSSFIVRELEEAAIFVAENRAAGRMSDLDVQKYVFARSTKFQKIMPTTSVWQMVEYFKNLKNEKYPLAELFDQVCGTRKKLKLNWNYQIGVHTTKTMKHQLAKQRVIYVSWAEKTLEDLSKPIGPAGHASSIIGMRFNKSKNTCEFLLRNSYGNSLQRTYDPKIRTQVANGNVWVSEKLMGEMMELATWIGD